MNKLVKLVTSGISLMAVLASSLLMASCGNNYGGYYDTISDDLYDAPLEKALREIISDNIFISYKKADYYFAKTEADPNNKDNILLYYTGESYTPYLGCYGTSAGTLTVEHVWCQSYFRTYSKTKGANDYDSITYPTPYSDLHNLRPCEYSVNSKRSNHMFDVNETAGDYNPFDPKNLTNGDETYRGEIARTLFYDATRYEKLELIEATSGSTTDSYQIGRLSTLLKWNLEYKVTDRETRRNNAIQDAQGNRNPFVDHPEYACRIWGNTNDATRAVCGSNY